MSCFVSKSVYLLLSLKTQGCVFSIKLRIQELFVDDSPNSQNGKVFCKVFTSTIHVPSRNFQYPDPSVFPPPSPPSKANISLILWRRSIMEYVLCGIRRPGICVLVQTTCRVLITTCAAKLDVRFNIFWEFVIADHVYHRRTTGQVEQQRHITLQLRLESWSGLISWTVLVMCLQPPASSLHLTSQMDHNSYKRHPKAQVTLYFFLCSIGRRSSYSGADY
jgi:hypothetical protein